MCKTLDYPKDFFYQSAKIFKGFGLWYPENYSVWMKPLILLGRINVFFFLGFYLYTNTYSGVPIYSATNDTDRLVDALSYSTAIVTFQIKLIIVTLNEKRIKNIIKQLEHWTFEHRNDVEKVQNIQNALKQYSIIFWLGEFIFAFTIITYSWYPVLGQEGRIIPMDTSITYGVDMHEMPYYGIFVTYEFIGIFSNTTMCMAFDMMFCGILAVTASMLENVNVSIKRHLIDDHNFPKENPEYKEKLLISCVKKYVDITEFMDDIQETYMISSLVHFSYNYIVMGICMYQMSKLPFGSRFLSMFGGASSVTVQLITCCYFGQRLQDENQNFWNHLCMCKWYNQTKNFKQILLLSLRRSQKEYFIHAGRIMPLSRETMKKVFQGIFTYYMFLMKARKD